MLKVGDKAPDFTGMTDEGSTFQLSDWVEKQHVVLYFYPKAFTLG
jgi:peroxiredoxin Q/BCP